MDKIPQHILAEFLDIAKLVHTAAQEWTHGCGTSSSGFSTSTASCGLVDHDKLYTIRTDIRTIFNWWWKTKFPVKLASELLEDVEELEANLGKLAALGGYSCLATCSLKGKLQERFAVLKAALILSGEGENGGEK